MSGIYIKGMEMPTSCVLCRMSEYHVTNPYCKITEAKILRNRDRNNDCPLVPVPDHGRLVDADALCELCNNSKLKSVDANDIMRMPVIIPADRKDGAE